MEILVLAEKLKKKTTKVMQVVENRQKGIEYKGINGNIKNREKKVRKNSA